MFSASHVIKTFSEKGATILSDEDTLLFKLIKSKAIILDWDGVFNEGIKGKNTESTFSEIDSMGLNLLRYTLWTQIKQMPLAFIVSGAENESAYSFAKREAFTGVYLDLKDKREAITHISKTFHCKPEEIICIFDDVPDLAMAKDCGLRFLISDKSKPLFTEYVKRTEGCDYITACHLGENPIREICEFLIGISENYEMVISDRVNFSKNYQQYWAERKKMKPAKFYSEDLNKKSR